MITDPPGELFQTGIQQFIGDITVVTNAAVCMGESAVRKKNSGAWHYRQRSELD